MRGRTLKVPPGARPTPARARETLFNWLAPDLPGARCLDLFAGAGALGMEALSRGAARCVFVESQRSAARMLREAVAEWGLPARVAHADARRWLGSEAASAHKPMDIVFLDPPFGSGLAARCCTLLAVNGWLAENCRLYLESHKRESLPELSSELRIVREKVVGDVRLTLAAAGRSAEA